MKKNLLRVFRFVMLLTFGCLSQANVAAQLVNASVQVDTTKMYQKITGFGGFVNSPQFDYGFMSESEIRQMWGAGSEGGYNIMRMYIPIGDTNWSQVLSTAKLAKSLGVKLFATPWSMPPQWKTYNTINAVYVDSSNVTHANYLSTAHYADYANYLNNFVVYLRNNGVALDAISIQNEPDEPATYAGCQWTPAQITSFLTTYRSVITCPVMAPESVGLSDNFANAFNVSSVLPNFDIYAGHQYGGIQTAYKNVQAQGKEVWMTEYLINWNSGVSRNFSWATDAFTFASSVNTALLGNVNAWVHYATKRFYGLIGDGTFGTTLGVVTKRGKILSHYADYIVGTKRTQATFTDNTGLLYGSSYLSTAGDTAILVIVNPSANNYNLAVSLPFLSSKGKVITTTETVNMASTDTVFTQTNRPKITIGASSVSTLIFVKSGNLVPSQMISSIVNYDKIDDKAVSSPSFGTTYQLSGKAATFKNGSQLISNNTTAANGYVKLDKKFNRLVFHVDSIFSALSYTSASTTLYYVNSAGVAKSYNYGTVNYPSLGKNFDWSLDISENVLTDGCTGVIGISNGNYSSILTLYFGNVFFAVGTERGEKFTNIYSGTDNNLLTSLDDTTYTSLDFTGTTGIPTTTNWYAAAANKNCVFYTQTGVLADKTNVVSGSTCNTLSLIGMNGNFYPPVSFTANTATYSATLNGYKMLILPFTANIPSGVKAYTVAYLNPNIKASIITNGSIPANTPVLVFGNGTYTFQGVGGSTISPVVNPLVGITNGVYIGIKVPIGAYYLTTSNGNITFTKATAASQPSIGSFDAYILSSTSAAASLPLTIDETALAMPIAFTTCPTTNLVIARPGYNTYNHEPLSMYTMDTATGKATLITGGPLKDSVTNANIEVNGAGLNTLDGFVYAIRDTINIAGTAAAPMLYRIGNNYGNYMLGLLPAPALSTGENLSVVIPSAGSFDDQGNYYYIGMAGSYSFTTNSFTPSSYYIAKLANVASLSRGSGMLAPTWTKIDFSNMACMGYEAKVFSTISSASGAGAGTVFQDITYSNLDKSLYVYAAYQSGGGYVGQLLGINPTTGMATCYATVPFGAANNEVAGISTTAGGNLSIFMTSGDVYKTTISGTDYTSTLTKLGASGIQALGVTGSIRGDLASCSAGPTTLPTVRTSGFVPPVIATNLPNQIVAYPNPAQGLTTIAVAQPLSNATIRLMGIAGNVITEQNGISGTIFKIDMTGKPSGIYLIEVIQGGNTQLVKIMK